MGLMTDNIDIDELLTRHSANEIIHQLTSDGLFDKLDKMQTIRLLAALTIEQQAASAATIKLKPFKADAVISASEKLVAAIDTCLSDGRLSIDDAEIELLERTRDAASGLKWTYPVKCNFKKLTQMDRVKSLISGPLFTSELHPWPTSDDGKPLEPICQLNLTDAGSVAEISLGNGLLQLWMDGISGKLREIPHHDVHLDSLTDVPDEITSFVWESPMADRFYGTANPWTHGYVITGVRRRILTIPSRLTSLVEDRSQKFSAKAVEKAFASLEKLRESGGMSAPSPGELSYFGNFNPIQYDESERPDTLFLMESGDIFTWGDCGNAQIFYHYNPSGKLEFSFDWSCT